MPDPVNYPDWATWPDLAGDEVSRAILQQFLAKTIARIGTLPEDYTGSEGQVIAVNAAGTGPTPAADTEADHLLFGLKGVRGFKAAGIQLAGSIDLTDSDHSGASIEMANSSAAVLTVTLDSDPEVGVSTRFQVSVRRLIGSAAVSIALGPGLTNRNPDGHTSVTEGRPALISVIGTDVYFDGYTET